MTSIARRGIAAAVTLVAVGGTAALSATTAAAAPAPQTGGAADGPALCRDADVTVTATPAPDHAAGHHADVLHYTAATPDTHCVLSGAPYGMEFHDESGNLMGVNTEAVPGQNAPQVTIDATHTATSYASIANAHQPGPKPVHGLSMHLPSDASSTPVGVLWPGNDLTGPVQFSTITQD